MTVRTAAAEDLDALVALEEACFGGDAWSAEAIRAELDAGTRYVVVAESPTGVEGYASLLVVADTADVQRIAVRPDVRRSGIGAALLDRTLAYAAERGVPRVLLEVEADNAAALALYERRGFTRISRRRGYYGLGRDAVVMLHQI